MTVSEAIRRAVWFERRDDPDDIPARFGTLAAAKRSFNKRGGLVYAIWLDAAGYEAETFLFGN